MASSRTPIGTFGWISATTTSSGVAYARTRYRDDDGRVRKVEATGTTRAVAVRRLKQRLTERVSYAGGEVGELTADSPFPELVEAWLGEVAANENLAPKTRELYENTIRRVVLPVFEHFTLREVTVSKVDRFLRAQAQISHPRAQQSKNVLRQSLNRGAV